MATYAPYHVDIAPWMEAKASSTYTFTRANNSTRLGMGNMNGASASANAHMEWDVALAAGTWTLTVIWPTYASGGVVTPSLNGSDLSTFDTYTAGTVGNVVTQWTGITVGTAGVFELKFRTDSKNASSSAYDCAIQWITLTRTGA